MKELSIEEKAKRYDEAIEKAKKELASCGNGRTKMLKRIFPELKESEDDRIRKELIAFLKENHETGKADETWSLSGIERWIAWLENQSQETSWKPSKEEMDALYGLAYITNNMDDKKVEAITKLYQDLKREFFNGVSYENMFPSSPVDAPIKLVEQKPIPKFKIGDTMRTLQEAKDGWTNGMPFIVSIDSEHYNCNSEKLLLKTKTNMNIHQ